MGPSGRGSTTGGDRCGMEDFVTLGKTGIRISPLGLGTWQWGDRLFWSYGKTHTDADVHEAFQVSLEAGITFIDTAEVYGRGRSERLLGQFLPEASPPVVVATKFMPLPWRLGKNALIAALRRSLTRLRLDRVDLYQVHWPFPPRAVEVWADGLADAVEAGLARAVGVSNYSTAQMSRAHAVLSKRGVPLASNQVEYNLLNRKVERNGLLERCHELGVTLIAYSPLAMGMLTGKYTPDNPPRGMRRRMFRRTRLAASQPLIGLLREIGTAHDRKAPAQVALNWLISKGVVPIPGAKNARQAADNAEALGWRLSDGEVIALDEASRRVAHL